MADILIRAVPSKTVRLAKSLARRHGQSLQEELRRLLIGALELRSGAWSDRADRVRDRIARTGRRQSDSAALLRDDRDR